MKFLAKLISKLLWILVSFCSVLVLICSAVYLYLGPSLPSVESLKTIQLQTPLRIYSADNVLIEEFGELRRTPLHYSQIPPHFVQALTAVEDRFFEYHIGVDARGFTRAVLEFVSSGEKGGGGSTLTQQVAKNYFLSNKKQFTRKFREILLALQMEQVLTKREIFELYANKMFFGHRAYGIQAAAQVYYGKDINDLSLGEIAMIAGLPQRPSKANPLSYPEAAMHRRDKVLSDMRELGYISEASYRKALQEPNTARRQSLVNQDSFRAAWVAEMVRDDMVSRFGKKAYSGGYRVYTTINSHLQTTANKSVVRSLLDYDRRHGFRGAYRKLPFDAARTTEEQAPEWLETLREEPDYGDLTPSVVVSASSDRLILLTKQGDYAELSLKKLKWARRYLDNDHRGGAVSAATEVAAPGDMLWLENSRNGWQLAQIPKVQGAFVALDPDTGAVQALVGGFDFRQSKYNRVLQAARQPGSNIKPFLYSAALEKGYTAATIVNDSPITIVDHALDTTWRPKNSGYVFDGPIRLREALYRSKNVVSIRILQDIGIPYAKKFISRFGIKESTLPDNLTLALGSASVTPIELVGGYATFANGGYRVSPYVIQRIEDASGNIIFENSSPAVCRECPEGLAADQTPSHKPAAERILNEDTVYVMDSILRDVIQRGTGVRAKVLGRKDIAGKTGTTNEGVDAWFSGFNSQIVASAWVGFDNPQPLGRSEWGGKTALPIWIDFMKVALKNRPEYIPAPPQGLVTVKIDPETGLRARPGQKNAVFEYFPENSVPTEQAGQTLQYNMRNNNPVPGQPDSSGDNSQTENVSAPELLF